MQRRDDRAGVMTVWAALTSVALIIVMTGVAAIAAAAAARHRAQSAADLAALAAATVRRDQDGRAGLGGPGGESGRGHRGAACGMARQIASANGARLRTCRLDDGGDVVVVATVELLGITARGAARAGPVAVTTPPAP